MKKLLFSLLILGLFACTPDSDNPRNVENFTTEKTLSFYESHPEVLKTDLEKCKETELTKSKRDNSCSVARKAYKEIKAKEIIKSANKRAFPDR